MGAVTDPAAVYRRVMEAEWPPSREARWAIGWAAATLWDALQEMNGSERTAAQAVDCAKALENQFARYQARYEAEVHIAVRQMTQLTGGVI